MGEQRSLQAPSRRPITSADWHQIGCSKPLLVLDIETRADTLAQRLARRPGAKSIHLRELVSVSCLVRLEAHQQPRWLLRSFHREDLSEKDMLENLHAMVEDLSAADGTLVTYNGIAHDLPVIRQRQLRWWQCDRPALLDYMEGHRLHVDVMRSFVWSGPKFATLTDACASVGFALAGPPRLATHRVEAPYERQKSELDVIGAAIAFFYVAADRARSNQVLSEGLLSLLEFLQGIESVYPHLAHLTASPSFSSPEDRSVFPWAR